MGRDNGAMHTTDHRRRDEDVRAAALHFVRTVTGAASPAGADRAAYERAVTSVAEATCCLLDELDAASPAPGHDLSSGTDSPTARSAGRCRHLQAV